MNNLDRNEDHMYDYEPGLGEGLSYVSTTNTQTDRWEEQACPVFGIHRIEIQVLF